MYQYCEEKIDVGDYQFNPFCFLNRIKCERTILNPLMKTPHHASRSLPKLAHQSKWKYIGVEKSEGTFQQRI